MLVLLDLLGMPDPTFFCSDRKTQRWYSQLADIEDRLSHAGQMDQYIYSSVATHGRNLYFGEQSVQNLGISDDHIPFQERGVPILHIIPVPFPLVWHKLSDNREAIDMLTVENLNKIFRVFVVEYLHLTVV